jgi:uncharacterized protein YjbI with pentapeptide repeats
MPSHAGTPKHCETRERLVRQLEACRAAGEAPDLRAWSLAGADLAKLDLSGADLSGVDLTGTDLSGANLAGAVLRKATLFEADLDHCELLGVELVEANLERCHAPGAGLGGTDLTGASFFGADLSGATLSHARARSLDLRGANLRKARLQSADLCGSDASGADLREADLSSADVARASFQRSDLRLAVLADLVNFEQADWIGADIREADFRGGHRLRRSILDENFLHEFRTRSGTSRVLYWLWWVTSDCGRSFVRWGLWSALIVVCFAAAYAHVGIDFGDHRTFLSPLYFSVITVTTLGYGDVVPSTVAGQIVSMLEVTIGYLALGGLIGIFSNKMARRAD